MESRSGNEQVGQTLKKSRLHRQILDIAEKQPQASMGSIAEALPNATVELVEHVFEEYGDPAKDAEAEKSDEGGSNSEQEVTPQGHQDEGTVNSGDGQSPSGINRKEISESDHGAHTDVDITEGQRKVLRMVSKHPDATQQEIGEQLGVSAPTVSNRINAIEGFNWQRRNQAVRAFFEQDAIETPGNRKSMSTNDTESTLKTERLKERIDTLENQVADTGTSDQLLGTVDLDLLQKVLHACFKSEFINEDEEIHLLNVFLQNNT